MEAKLREAVQEAEKQCEQKHLLEMEKVAAARTEFSERMAEVYFFLFLFYIPSLSSLYALSVMSAPFSIYFSASSPSRAHIHV